MDGKFKDKAYAAQYLAKALEVGDSMNLQYVLVDIIEAQGGFRKVAEGCGMSEEALRVMVHDEAEQWRLLRLARMMKAMGFEVALTPGRE